MLNQINSPEDLRKLDREALPFLCKEIREMLIEVVSKNGGHLSSNLGIVEATVALHYVFQSPEDKILWDVGHQAYVH
ncbi:MAG: 1-deoxy-D-xylulose-5-phosphate synthase, partial [Ruminococcaceae bacterium]|nr:1-deoxy-D-xylulose-5-phosphate synthase [Oscillospiraceae bacterium]